MSNFGSNNTRTSLEVLLQVRRHINYSYEFRLISYEKEIETAGKNSDFLTQNTDPVFYRFP